MLPLVSFLVPAYNHESYVVQCLDSILSDRYENKEIVIIDDGSSDGTAAAIEQWIARHEHLIEVIYRSRPNRGVTATLNELGMLARGEMLRLGASDDYFLADGTCALAHYLVAHPEKLAVIGDAIVVDPTGTVLHQSAMTDLHRVDKRAYGSERDIVRAVISQWAVSGPVPLVRRQAMEAGWNESLRIDDWDFFLRIAAQGGLGFVDTQVCAYRVHDTNTSRVSDVRLRIRNLHESRQVAARHVGLFPTPYAWLLRAQCRLIDAKIAFLQRRPVASSRHLAVWGALRLMAAAGAMLHHRGD